MLYLSYDTNIILIMCYWHENVKILPLSHIVMGIII